MSQVSVLGIDLAKQLFHVVGEESVIFCPFARAPSKARPCQPGVDPGSGSPGQAPDTECCMAEGHDGHEAYTGS
jgi:hypothetical protein